MLDDLDKVSRSGRATKQVAGAPLRSYRSERRSTRLLLALSCLALTGAAEEPLPRVRALLIGVQDYPNLAEPLHLRAPAADVARLRTALTASGMRHDAITVMTEREGRRPTRAAILAALDELAATAGPQDRVLVYFSGHGSQAPARRPGREPDGLEELFLAADTRRWDGGAGRVPGAIADFELEAALQAIRAKGAEVWFVADACHAGGLTRAAAPAGARAKSVSSADIGAPVSAAALRAPSVEPAPLSAQGRGGFAGFYAAPPGQLALERPLPAGMAGAAPASVFTYALVKALHQGRFRTLRDLALAVSASGETGASAPAPVFEGDLGASVLGLSPARQVYRVRQVRGDLMLDAGVFEGFEPGAEVRLLTWPEMTPAGTGAVADAGAAWSRVISEAVRRDQPLAAELSRTRLSLGSSADRLLAALPPSAGSGEASRLDVEARLWRGGCGPQPPARLGFPADASPLDLLAPPPLRHCDVVYLKVRNGGDDAVDVTPLYLDAAGAIVALSFAPVDSVRLAPGETRFAAFRVLTRDSRGRALPQGVERLVLIAAPAGPRPFDLRSLAQPAAYRGEKRKIPDVDALIFALRTQD